MPIVELPLVLDTRDREISTSSPFYSGKDSFLGNCDVYNEAGRAPYIMNREGIHLTDVTNYTTDLNGWGHFLKFIPIEDTAYYGRYIYLGVHAGTNTVYIWNNTAPDTLTYADSVVIGAGGIQGFEIDAVAYDSEKVVLKDVFNLFDVDLTTTGSPSISKITTGGNYPTSSLPGLVYLDGFIFVVGGDRKIYNSDVGDPTTWSAGNFIIPQRTFDAPYGIAKHHDHIVYFGSDSIEFFYNANNPSGSPLKPRKDIYYGIGCMRTAALGDYGPSNSMPYAQLGDRLFFLGTTEKENNVKLMKLENFQITMFDNPIINQLINTKDTSDIVHPHLSAFEMNGEEYVFIQTGSFAHSDWANFAVNVNTGRVIKFSTSLPKLDFRALAYFANQYFLTSNGVLGNITKNAFKDVDENDTSYDIDMEIQTPLFTGEHTQNKFMSAFELQGDYLDGETIAVKYTDDDYQSWSTARNLSLSSRSKLSALGKFNRRAFNLKYSGQNRYRAMKAQITYYKGIV